MNEAMNSQRGMRLSLSVRLWCVALFLLLLSLALYAGVIYFYPKEQFIGAVGVFSVMAPISFLLIRQQLQAVFELIRAMSGTVLSYQDKDFSFGLHWHRNDELADLVDAHNELGQVLREQRLDLVQRELLLDSMLQNTPVAMCLVAESGHIVFANITARQFLNHGKKLEGHILENILLQLSPSLREAWAQGGDGLFTVVNNAKTSNKQLDADGNVEEDDLDEIYHLSRRQFSLNSNRHELFLIRHLTLELRRQEVQTWKKVIRVISHELNNSLAPVASLARSAHALLARNQLERLPEILNTIEERAVHLESFIHGYARFAKLPKPRLESVEWKCFIERLQSQIHFQLVGNLPTETMSFDPAQMEHALLNAIKNAHESGSAPEQITLEVKRMFQAVRIEVQDRGNGMSEEVMSNALIPFYSTKRNGTGLGLALTREITEAHGGRIALNNREGGGLVVSLILPC